VWWLDLIILGVLAGVWMVVPRWVSFTSSFYERLGLSVFALGEATQSVISTIIRGAILLVGVFAVVNLVRDIVH